MSLDCVFHGSYSNPEPWLQQACIAGGYAVPEGCGLHFITTAPIDRTTVEVSVHRGSDTMTVDSATTALGVVPGSVAAVDVHTCTCERITVPVDVYRYQVDAAEVVAGDYVTISMPGLDEARVGFTIGPATACPDVYWPSAFDASIACDPCTNPDPHDDAGNSGAGCSVGDGPPPLALALLAVAVMRATSRRSRRAA